MVKLEKVHFIDIYFIISFLLLVMVWNIILNRSATTEAGER